MFGLHENLKEEQEGPDGIIVVVVQTNFNSLKELLELLLLLGILERVVAVCLSYRPH